MDVLFYLKELLKSHNTIGIAGLGTLNKKKSPGKYDEERQFFVPPSYALSFTSQINEFEELVNFIAQEEQIDIDFAKLKINEFVEKIHNLLTYEHQATLNGLGKLILIDNEITFLNDEENELRNEFYGLPNLNEVTATLSEKESIAEAEVNPTDQKETDAVNIENEAPLINRENQLKFTGKPFTPNYDYDGDSTGEMNKSLKIFLKILLVITIIAATLGLAYFFNPSFFDNTMRSNDSEISNAEPFITNDSLNKKTNLTPIDSNKTTLLDSSTALKKQPKTIVAPILKTANSNIITYEVIGSAVKSQKRIDLEINTMKKRGIEAKALEIVPGRLTKISLGSFTNLTLAKKYKDSLRKKLNNPDIYIHTIKQKK